MSASFDNSIRPDEGVLIETDNRGRTNLSRIDRAARNCVFRAVKLDDGTLILTPDNSSADTPR